MDKFTTIIATMLFSISGASAYVYIYVIETYGSIMEQLTVLLLGFCIGATFHVLSLDIIDTILDYLEERRISKTLEELRWMKESFI